MPDTSTVSLVGVIKGKKTHPLVRRVHQTKTASYHFYLCNFKVFFSNDHSVLVNWGKTHKLFAKKIILEINLYT